MAMQVNGCRDAKRSRMWTLAIVMGLVGTIAPVTSATSDSGQALGVPRCGEDHPGRGPEHRSDEATPSEDATRTEFECPAGGGGIFLADFNDDDIGDLVVAAPYQDVNGVVDAGAVYVFYGGNNFTTLPPEMVTQDTPGVDDAAEAQDYFGFAVSAFDADGSGEAELVVGVPYEDLGAIKDAGAVQVVFGTPTGLSATPPSAVHPPTFITQDYGSIQDTAEQNDQFGYALTWGLLGGFPFAIGAPGESIGAVGGAGAVHLLQNDGAGLTDVGNEFWHQDVEGVPDVAEGGDRFGTSLAFGNFIRGVSEFSTGQSLVVGTPAEDVGSMRDAGAVTILHPHQVGTNSQGNPVYSGLTTAGAQLWTQTALGERSEVDDRFGSVFWTWDANGDKYEELAIGVPLEDVTTPAGLVYDAGIVDIVFSSGTSSGLTATGHRVLTQQTSSGSPPTETVETNDRFGSSLGQGLRGLVIGAPNEDVGDLVDAGVIHVRSMSTTTAAVMNQSAFDGQPVEAGDHFGYAVSLWNFNEPYIDKDDLAVTASSEDVVVNGTTVFNAGAVNVAFNNSPSITLTASSAGGTPQTNGYFGRILY